MLICNCCQRLANNLWIIVRTSPFASAKCSMVKKSPNRMKRREKKRWKQKWIVYIYIHQRSSSNIVFIMLCHSYALPVETNSSLGVELNLDWNGMVSDGMLSVWWFLCLLFIVPQELFGKCFYGFMSSW